MQSQFKVSLFSVDGKSSSDCALKVAFFNDKLSKWVELYKCAGDTVSSFVATSDCYNIQGKLPKEHKDLEQFLCNFMAKHEKKPEAYVSSGVVINDRLYLTFIQPGIYNVLEFTIVDKDPLSHLVNKLKDALADKGISQKTYATEVNEVQKTESLPVLDDSKISCQNTEYVKVIPTEANNDMPKHISPSDTTFTELHLVSKVEPTKQGNVTERQVYEDLTQDFYDKVAESALKTDLPKNTLHESQVESVKDKAEVTSPRSTKSKISAKSKKSVNEDQVNKLPDIGSFSTGGWDDEVPETHMPKPTQVQPSQFSGRGRGSFNDYSNVSRGGYNQRGESNYNRPQENYTQGKAYGQYNQDSGRGRGGFGGQHNAAPYGNPQYGSYNQQQNYEGGNQQQDNARGRGGGYGATFGGYGGGRGGHRSARNPGDGNW